ncbi:MAG: ribonuclease Z [Lachnospiraceae bacterium]|nr:ribonuclease Z [Lachnospiraceae bacterium]
MIDVCLLGTGGMMPMPFRWLTSLLVRYNGKQILVDCGEGTQITLRKRGFSSNPIDVMLFTHYHADHISGLPGMLLSMANSERTEPVLMVGPRGLERVVNSLRVIAPGLPFQIEFRELSEPEESFTLPGEKDFLIRAFKVQHSVPCYGYAMELSRTGRFQVEKAEALGLEKPLWGRLQKGETIRLEDGRVITPDQVLGETRKGLKLAYVTDTRPCEAIVRAAEGADLMICEGMYGDESKHVDAVQKKHMTFREAAKLAAAAQPEQMWLTHYSPSLLRPEEFMDPVREIFPNAYAGKDGKTTTLRFLED